MQEITQVQRVALGVEYLGAHYHGWQVQPAVPSVQGCLQDALSRIANHPIEVVCAGRTDRGVHATQQVVHFDTTAKRSVRTWQQGVLSLLPSDIGVIWSHEVDSTFHARFSAQSRGYRYVLFNAEYRPALLHGRVSWFPRPLDVARMQDAAMHLIGEHDFSSFRGRDCQALTPMRHVQSIRITQSGVYIYFDLVANAFLHHMVRNIVGTLFQVGMGKRPVEWVLDVLSARRREAGGITAPADGLYLTHVQYPAHFSLPLRERLPQFF